MTQPYLFSEYNKKDKSYDLSLLCRHRPIFPGRHQPSIVGVNELNYRVRNGNGCTLTTNNTYYSVRISAPSKLNSELLDRSIFPSLPKTICSGQALDLLVSVRSIHYCTSTPDLSTTSSTWGLTSEEWENLSYGEFHA